MQRLQVLAEQQALVKQRADLPLQRAGAPVLGGRFSHVPLARLGTIHAGEQAVVRPAQFGTHCVPNWKGLKKRPHVAQVALIKALAELGSELLGQHGQ